MSRVRIGRDCRPSPAPNRALARRRRSATTGVKCGSVGSGLDEVEGNEAEEEADDVEEYGLSPFAYEVKRVCGDGREE